MTYKEVLKTTIVGFSKWIKGEKNQFCYNDVISDQ